MKNLLLTGAGGGIGRAIIPVLAEKGYKLLLTTRSSIQELASFVKDLGIDAPVFQADLTVDAEVKALAEWTEAFGGVDILVNNAGVAHAAAAWKLDAEEMAGLMNTNFLSAVRCTQAVLGQMRTKGWGRVICISSVVAHKPSFGTAAYAASKSALEGYMRGVAHDVVSKGVTANTIAYGYMEAGMLHDVPEPLLDEVLKGIPAGQFGRPEQVADLIHMLVQSEYTTGQTLHVNGGQWMS
ncbi:MAG: 3-oxoacyl-[acyl-carrier-protein] reductase [Bacteroidota bacterium]|jgi:NAD(P)-dependent dehydrogenase (short-subunit alcohol dehydrogenase family)